MIEFKSIASSSRGNAYIVKAGAATILLECGIPFKKLQKALDFDIGGIDFCLVTHEHADHCRAVLDVLAYGIPIYMSEGTAIMLNLENGRNKVSSGEIKDFSNGSNKVSSGEIKDFSNDVNILPGKKTAEIHGVRILPFPVRHDAAEPFGYLICEDDPGHDRLLFATDTSNIEYRFPGLTEIAIECNHDAALVDEDHTEPWQYRAMRNHMDIETVIRYLRKTDLSGVRRIHLLHMSDRNSNEKEFVGRIYKEFGIPVEVCGKM